MQVFQTELPGCVLIEPRIFQDDRGFFLETYHRERYANAGVDATFVQDNHSCSQRTTLRGLHYQIDRPQGKLVWVIQGEIFDVAVDLRRCSPTFGKWISVVLNAISHRQLYIPPGFAHGFCALSDRTEIMYKCTDVYSPEGERTIIWDDPTLAITWPVELPLLSAKDARGLFFSQAPTFD